METPEEFLMKHGICSDTTIGTEGDIPLTRLLEEYASQALRIHDVVGQSEQLLAFAHFLKWQPDGYISYSHEDEMVKDFKSL